MSWKCGFCGAASGPGEPMRRHTVYRGVPSGHTLAKVRLGDGRTVNRQVETPKRTEIDSETPICADCADFFADVDRL